MNIETLGIDKIYPYEFNNRNHSVNQIDLICKSIKQFGFNQPIVIDENGIVLVGHGRLLAAKTLGMKEVPVLKVFNLSEEKKRAYRILDNKLQNDSTWDLNNLELELGALEDGGFDLPEWGLEQLQNMFTKEEEPFKETNKADDGSKSIIIKVEEDELEELEQDIEEVLKKYNTAVIM